jgi:glutamate-1-semialdehyde 2,1-aminomutase
MSERYKESEALLNRAVKSIPLGTQTFSKSRTQYPVGAAPLYVTHAKGSRVWDVDGNEYIDFVNGLAAITLGHGDAEVTDAVTDQLARGVLFSLPHPVEIAVAEKIIDIVPSAQMVRFGKNGSDVTSAAVRLARAFTGRDHIIVCGYHGWQDWYIATTTRSLGIPEVIKTLSHKFVYNQIETLEKLFSSLPGQVAAVIMEPMNHAYPAVDFLQKVRDLTARNGALLIFDEVITGFRLAPGGAQELFGIMPDLTTMGKGLGNGYPVSAIAGRADVMKLLEEVFFSFTFGGEALSLAAANVVLRKIKDDKVPARLEALGKILIEKIQNLIKKHDVSTIFSISGHPSWTFLNIKDTAGYQSATIKTLLLQELFKRGILSIGTHNLSYAHSPEDLGILERVYDEVFPFIRDAVNANNLETKLECSVLQPVFKVR